MIAVQTPPTGTYRCLADLAPHVDGYELTGLKLAVSERFTRLTTVITLHGAGHRGVGEDTFAAAPEQMELCPFRPSAADFHNSRRWAFESAALDLARRQAVHIRAASPLALLATDEMTARSAQVSPSKGRVARDGRMRR